jgi:hypothetical protein
MSLVPEHARSRTLTQAQKRIFLQSEEIKIRGGADNFLARPGKKQATATTGFVQHIPHEAQ